MEEFLRKGSIYETNTHGDVEYLGTDTFCGQTTFKFKSLTYGVLLYWSREDIEDKFAKKKTP